MKKRAYLIAGAFLVSAYVLSLFLGFAREVTGYTASETGSDAIVVLTGGRNRVEVGLNLLRKGGGGVLVLSGVNRDADADSIFLNRLEKSERANIILEKTSRSTYENAVEVGKIMKERGLNSMVLITSAYHMKRALYIFKKVMPPEIRIKTYSVATPNFDERRWWAGRSLGILIVEFLKYYWYVARFSIWV